MDTLLPGCDDNLIPSQLEWVRPVLSRGQGRRECFTVICSSLQVTSTLGFLLLSAEPNARRDDDMGFHLPFSVVPDNLNCKSTRR